MLAEIGGTAMKRQAPLSPYLLLAFATALVCAGHASAKEACAPEGKVSYVCGPANVEDLILAPGTDWILGSGGTSPSVKTGRIYAIDARKKTWTSASVDFSSPAQDPYKACPGAPDKAAFTPHGIALRTGANGRHTFYALNHGGREAIEVFDLTAKAGATPSLKWIGCIPSPEGVSGNSIAPLRGGAMVMTNFMRVGDPQAFAKMAKGEKMVGLYVWTPGAGWKPRPGTEMSGANGVVGGQGGRIFANAWAEQKLYRFGPGDQVKSVNVGFQPDNLRWAPDGKVLVGGQAAANLNAMLNCGKPSCPHGWTIVKVDPTTMAVTPVLHAEGTEAFSDATVGLQVGREVWVGTYRGDRVAWAPLP
jgi:hypothetical protein